MPFTEREGIRLYWKVDGAEGRPPLLLLNSIGTELSLWDSVVPHLLPHFQVLRMDTRGHGASDLPSGDYRLVDLAADAVSVLDAAGVDLAAVAGVSLGGMVAMELALAAPKRVSGLALICTSAKMDRNSWADRVEKVRSEGTEAIADLAMGRFFSPKFLETHDAIASSIRRELVAMSDEGYAGAAAAIRDMALADRLERITVPTLVISGNHDVATPEPQHGARIAEGIAGAQSARLNCGHLAPVEEPRGLATALIRFFDKKDGGGADEAKGTLQKSGMVNRRQVLGDAWVDSTLANRTSFNSDFQDLITRIAWHEIWGRPGLDHRTRRLLVIAVTASSGRWEEFRLHVRSGLEQRGITADELKEVLMQLAIYAGVPAANTAFTEAGEIIEAMEADRARSVDESSFE